MNQINKYSPVTAYEDAKQRMDEIYVAGAGV